MTQRLWDKGAALDADIHAFTVGDDPLLDLHLVHWDCIGSAAHARTLEQADLLTKTEADSLVAELARIDTDHAAGRFEIPPELEDCHTALEARLTAALGATGQKVHTARSRNDQVATAMRLYMRDAALKWLGELSMWIDAVLERLQRDGHVPMPGYTHMQPAMPSSVGQWLHAFAEAALEQMRATLHLLDLLDACPLGSGAGFGVNLPLDRAFTAKLLGFARVQRSPIDVQNSRGRMEVYFTRVAADCARFIEKFAGDLLLFSSRAYGFFALPESLTTGSSIMPQKRNPDVVELLRAHAAVLRTVPNELDAITAKLPSSYHRDLQLSKGPAIRADQRLHTLLPVARRVLAEMRICQDALRRVMLPELYATAAAFDLVRQGVPFREAYRRIADQLTRGTFDATPYMNVTSQPDSHTLARDLLAEREDLRRTAATFAQRQCGCEALLADHTQAVVPR